ncbi:17749_t:CDS:1, partial [Funneliformis geosporum]
HIVWIQNKVVTGVWTKTAATSDGQTYIDIEGAYAHKGYHLEIPNNVETFSLIFIVDNNKN